MLDCVTKAKLPSTKEDPAADWHAVQELDITDHHRDAISSLYNRTRKNENHTALGQRRTSSSANLDLPHSRYEKETTEASRRYEPSPISPSGPDSPKTIPYEPSGYDIELEELHVPLPPPATRSTDRLVLRPLSSPAPSIDLSSSAASFVTSAGSETTKKGQTSESRTAEVPDYKQLSLRWPFMLFIFTLIWGFFAFLEYEINDLPPVHYSMIPFNAPRPDKAIPDPRPPESNYPKPPTLTATYCGWSAPKWEMWQFSQASCDDLYCDDWDKPAWCQNQDLGGGHYLYCVKQKLVEKISLFTTDDPSWCPCEGPKCTFFSDYYKGPIWDKRAGSQDSGCRSAMSAVVSFNNYKTKYQWLTTTGWAGYETVTAVPQLSTLKTGFWAFPKTDSDGAILMPLVVRTAGPEKQDAFGNPVEPSETALFPDGFAGELNPWGQTIPYFNPCSMSNMFSGVRQAFDRWDCPEAHVRVFSTVWWTLPLTRPTTVTPIESPSPTPAVTTTHWMSSVDIITSTAQVVSSATTFPICTNCASESSAQSTDSQLIGIIVPTSTKPTSSKVTQDPISSGENKSSDSRATSRPEETTSNTTKSPLGNEPQISTSSATQLPSDPTQETLSSAASSATAPAILPIGVDQPTSRSPSSASNSSGAQSPRPDVVLGPAVASSLPSSQAHNTNRNNTFPTPTIVRPGQKPSPDQEQAPQASGYPFTKTSDRLIPPTATPGGPIGPSSQDKFFNLRSETDYLMASVVPVLLATLFAIPIQVFVTSMNSMLPFRTLGHYHQGVTAEDSLCLSRNPAFYSPLITGSRLLYRFLDPLPLLGFILGTLSTVLIPISSEVIRLEYTTECSWDDDGLGIQVNPLTGLQLCAFGVRKSGPLVRTTEGVLVAMALLTIAIGYLLMRWRTGVLPEPWSVASMATLLSAKGSELANLLRTASTKNANAEKPEGGSISGQIEETMANKRFQLGYIPFPDQGITPSYGINATDIPIKEDISPITPTTKAPPTRKSQNKTSRWSAIWQKLSITGTALDLTLRASTLVFILGLLVLIFYYENTVGPDTDFERFMNSQSFGVRILFTAFGSIISAFWGYYFLYISESQIHTRLAESVTSGGLPSESSILLSPPSNPFVSIYSSVKTLVEGIPLVARFSRKQREARATEVVIDWTSFNIALATILSKFTPILLSNIPFSNAVTWKVHEACTWLSVAFLGYMVLVLGCTFLPAGALSSVLGRRGEFAVGSPEVAQIGGIVPYAGDIKHPVAAEISAKCMEAREHRVGESSKQGSLNNSTWQGDQATHTIGEAQRPGSGRTEVKDLPVKLDTIAGVMYYLCDSKMLKGFESLANGKPLVNKEERDRIVIDMGRRYTFGEITGASTGQKRLGVDYIDHRRRDITDGAA